MKKLLFVPLAALAFAASCADTNPFSPGTEGSRMLPTPRGPLFDDISNKIDGTIDAAAELMPLNVGGPNGTTKLYVAPTNGDGKSGCNLTGATTLGVSVSSDNIAVATVSPSSLTFGSCGDSLLLTITPVAVGSATISLTQTSNSTAGTFYLASATFTVTVTLPPNTAPSISITGVTAGASYPKGLVPAAVCSVTDAEDGNSTFAANLSPVIGPYSADGIGSQVARCTYTDAGGLKVQESVMYSIVDPSPPTIGYILTPASPDGSNGWYKSNVTLTWNVSEPQSPNSLVKTGCVDQNITADQLETTYSCAATSAGGAASPSPVEVKIKRDATAPTTTATRSPLANSFGWHNSAVTVDFNGTDAPSGIASCDADITLASEGANQSATGSCTDNAGNSSSDTENDIDIDLTNPNVSLVGGPTNGVSYYFGSVPAAPTCSASDVLSGLNGACGVSGYSAAVGTHTVTASANDKAGNSASASVTYTVLAWTLQGFYQPVDMPNMTNTVKSGSTVPFKFEIFAGPTELTDVSAVKSFITTPVACSSLTSASDDIESTTTGGTNLRYDLTGGQFVQNWQTTGKVGACFKVTMTAQDDSYLTAFFKLK
jgi:hypothetical protein